MKANPSKSSPLHPVGVSGDYRGRPIPRGRKASSKARPLGDSERDEARASGEYRPRKRKNVEGFMAGGQFHPIRKSADYNEFIAGDHDRKSRAKKSHLLTLSEYVRRSGGINTKDKTLSGELRKLTPKESGTTGLVNSKSKYSPDGMLEKVNEEGYSDPNGGKFSNVGDFLYAIEMDARGIQTVSHPERYAYNPATHQPSLFDQKRLPIVSGGGVKRSLLDDARTLNKNKTLSFHTMRQMGHTALQVEKAIERGDLFWETYGGLGVRGMAERKPKIIRNPKLKTIVVTPVKAKQLLKGNFNNRAVDAKRVAQIARTMKGGNYLDKRGLQFSGKQLVDGQHRLLAVVRSGATVVFNVKQVNPQPTPKTHAKGARKAAQLHESFQGRPHDRETVIKSGVPASLDNQTVTQLGYLREAVIGGRRYKNFPQNARLVADARNKLHMIGFKFRRPEQIKNPDEVLLLGELESVVYDTAKEHIGNGKRFLFCHSMGEEGGKRPQVYVTHDGGVIVDSRGSDYKIEARGIVN